MAVCFSPETDFPITPWIGLKVSIIIPTLNEGLVLERTLMEISRHAPHELIIADGGSRDDTLHIARKFTTRIIQTPPERARQMNAAAWISTGDILLFLHADSRVDIHCYRKMIEVIRQEDKLGGAFSLAIDSEKMSLRLISALATLRSKYLHLVYGDQAIFVRTRVFQEMGGFSSLPICEDLDFFRRLRERGSIVVLDEKAQTSARRWLEEGIWFTTLRNAVIATLFLLGFSPRILSKWYLAIR